MALSHAFNCSLSQGEEATATAIEAGNVALRSLLEGVGQGANETAVAEGERARAPLAAPRARMGTHARAHTH
eukprot:2392164-Pleurochrysis_carterae.AAC.1